MVNNGSKGKTVKIEEDAEPSSLQIVPKIELADVSPSSGPIQLKLEYGASSSSSNLRSQFIEMGFAPALVEKVLNENGDNDAEAILNELFTRSTLENEGAESSFSGLFDSDKEEEVNDYQETKPSEKRAYLLGMNFSNQQIDSALEHLGENAPLEQLVDYIVGYEENETKPFIGDISLDEEINAENLLGLGEKTLWLLKKGFTDQEVESVIEKFGNNVPLTALVDSILESRMRGGNNHDVDSKENVLTGTSTSTNKIKPEIGLRRFNPSSSRTSFYCNNNIEQTRPDKKPRNNFTLTPQSNHNAPSGASITGPPFFIYGNVFSLSREIWTRCSEFLFNIEPEFVNSQNFSALIRIDGYIHNLPTERRNCIVPKSPLTIETAIPETRKFWPDWDPRRQFNNLFDADMAEKEIRQLCVQLEKNVTDSGGLSREKKDVILEHCKNLNLIWVGKNKLSPLEPQHLERVMGYPSGHTGLLNLNPVDRSKALKDSYQTDTIGYILSPLKDLYPDGIRVLSLFTGIGGAEVALHRLGVRIKCLVSVEASETSRNIFKSWWDNNGQSGKLTQIGGMFNLTQVKMEEFMSEFGGFDLILGSNPNMCTTKSFFEFARIVKKTRNMMGCGDDN